MQEYTEEEKAILVKVATELFKASKSLYNIDVDLSHQLLGISDQVLMKFENVETLINDNLISKEPETQCGCNNEETEKCQIEPDTIIQESINCNGHVNKGKSEETSILPENNQQNIDTDNEIADLVSKIRKNLEN